MGGMGNQVANQGQMGGMGNQVSNQGQMSGMGNQAGNQDTSRNFSSTTMMGGANQVRTA